MTAWVALTGGIGSGKSQAACYFRQLGVPVIDADALNRTLITTPGSPALVQIADAFGKEMLDGAGCLNRPAMRRLIFADPAAKHRLETILHPLIIRAARAEQARHRRAVYGLVELPTLAEHPHFGELAQRVLLVQGRERQRIARVMRRSRLTEAEVRAVIAAQSSDTRRRQLADDVLHNSGSLRRLLRRVRTQHLIYQRNYALF